jgi:hypothetical protein
VINQALLWKALLALSTKVIPMFVNTPIITMLGIKAIPGFSRTGIQNKSTIAPTIMETVPSCIPVSPAKLSFSTSQGPRPKFACFIKAMLKPMKANPVSNFAQRLSKVVNDDLISFIKAFQQEIKWILLDKLK